MTLNERDAAHVYEWVVAVMGALPDIKTCYTCARLKKRLERCIGVAETRRVRRVVRTHPYFQKGKHK